MATENQEYIPVEQGYNQQINFNPYKPRFISYFTMLFAGIGLITLVLFIILTIFTEYLTVDSIYMLLQPFIAYKTMLLVVAIAFLVLAIASEIYSRVKTPPATWRVKNELVRTLSQYGLLDLNNTDRWKGMFAVAPVGRYNRKAQSFTLPFLLRHANAKQSFEKIGDSISGFARCYSAQVLEDNSRRMYNCKLVLWYTDNPYGEISIEDMFDEE